MPIVDCYEINLMVTVSEILSTRNRVLNLFSTFEIGDFSEDKDPVDT